MSKNNRRNSSVIQPSLNSTGQSPRFFKPLNPLLIIIICLVALGALGAGLKYLETDAKREMAERSADNNQLNKGEKPSWLNNINPFLPNPPPPPTPTLAKEYLYAQ